MSTTVATTYNDDSPAQTSTTVQQIQFPHLATLNQEQDFAGHVLRSTTTKYMSGGIYSAKSSGTVFNMLNHVQSRTDSEPATGKSVMVSNTYDTLGNLTLSSITAAGLSAATKQYTISTQGDVTQIKDPMQYAGTHSGATTFAYTDQAISGCPHSTGPGIPTLTTDALGHTTKKAFYPIGSLACVQDVNGNITQYSYDQLGRPSAVMYPDGGSTNYTASTSPPLTFTTNKVASPSPSQQTASITDGFGRVVQMQISAPEGTICTESY